MRFAQTVIEGGNAVSRRDPEGNPKDNTKKYEEWKCGKHLRVDPPYEGVAEMKRRKKE